MTLIITAEHCYAEWRLCWLSLYVSHMSPLCWVSSCWLSLMLCVSHMSPLCWMTSCWLLLMLCATYELLMLDVFLLTVTHAVCHIWASYAGCLHAYCYSCCVSHMSFLCWMSSCRLSLMLCFTYEPLLASVFMLNVVLLSVLAPFVVVIYDLMLRTWETVTDSSALV
jgi:hypothetical protein